MSPILYAVLILLCILHNGVSKTGKNNRPIIGVLSQKLYYSENSFYIYAQYIEYLKQTGAGVVPIRMNMNISYYEEMFKSINGLLLPGGSANLFTSQYCKVGRFFYDKAIEANDKGDYFPIWGTCLGFEYMSIMTAERNTISNCSADNVNMNVKFTADAKDSRLYGSLNDDIFSYIRENNATQNNHHFCLTSKFFYSNKKLTDFYNVLSVNNDRNGLEFISTIEAKKYPFYGVQYHPEKNAFLYSSTIDVPNKEKDIEFSSQLARFFVKEARKSNHEFPSLENQAENLIENFCPLYSGAPQFTQKYVFKQSDPYGV